MQTVKLSEVKIKGPFKANEYLVGKLMNSLVVDGQKTPILVNDAMYVLDGRHRLEAMRRLKLEYIDVTTSR